MELMFYPIEALANGLESLEVNYTVNMKDKVGSGKISIRDLSIIDKRDIDFDTTDTKSIIPISPTVVLIYIIMLR